ncbi:hypothetical protein EXIGLDRAFT_508718 [Exidia glandulosa HHB12029]|uniref:ditrans,polycis-polyprenyl diphosphate synthase [(2E,6E)-farnesyldiphosphate specific] n=1 Tax=Exidia glandulosa HHB12029 TaxID=1314781 RepID=A0A165PCU9_EXIGL|nr:hypothetical protein EXIGLDRAFT_508718 [Exidia glandulosa HHB12029]
MSSLAAAVLLAAVHSLYRLFCFAQHAWRSLARRSTRLRVDTVAPTLAKIPKHVALILAYGKDEPWDIAVMTESARRAARWCEEVAIPNLSVYDRDGLLLHDLRGLCNALSAERVEHVVPPSGRAHARERVHLQHPLTPPPSEHSEANSRSWSPEPEREAIITLRRAEHPSVEDQDDVRGGLRKRRRSSHSESVATAVPLTIRILSRDAGKPQLASVAKSLLEQSRALHQTPKQTLTVEEVDALIFDMTGLPEIDLLVIHPLNGSSNRPLEMHGFPPWQMRLAELYYNSPRPFSLHEWWSGAARPLTEDAFCRALREFGSAEQRVGK